jgi:hypothetical protein
MLQISHLAAPSPPIAKAGQGAKIMEYLWVMSAASAPNGPGERKGAAWSDKVIWGFAKKIGLDPAVPPKPSSSPWDAAIETVLLSEEGRLEEARERLAYTPSGPFRACWEAAYGSGPIPSNEVFRRTSDALSNGLASKLMEASIEQIRGRPDAGLTKSAVMDHYKRRAAALFLTSIAILLGAVSGVAIGIWMMAKKPPLPDMLTFQMPAPFAIRVCLGWYISFFLSSVVVEYIGRAASLGAWALPLNYSMHAACGIAFICIAEKTTPMLLWRMLRKKSWQWLPKGAQFFLVALGAML